jgi:quercetin dioxygenase-like cupin family protein
MITEETIMSTGIIKTTRVPSLLSSAAALGVGLLIGAASGGANQTTMEVPTEHRGVSVVNLGVVSEASLQKQIGLGGHFLQLREITLEPGGVIAPHSHAKRPGLAWTIEGTWTEVRGDTHREYPDTEPVAIIEDENADHWFYNHGTESVRVVVCDINPTS